MPMRMRTTLRLQQSLFPLENPVMALKAIPVPDIGHVGMAKVIEDFVAMAKKITEMYEAHRHANHVQLGHVIQVSREMDQATQRPAAAMPQANPIAERDKLRRLINRHVRRLAMRVYNSD